MLAPIFATLCISGFCVQSTPPIRASINALATPDARSQTRFLILPGVPGVQLTDLQFQEYAAEVGRALTAQGFEQAKTPDDVTLVVMVGWDMSAPRDRLVTGTTTSMTQQRVMDGISRPMAPGLPASIDSHTEFQAVQTPTAETVTSYVRTLRIKAFDQAFYKATKTTKELWEANVVSEGTGGDMRAIFPVLVASAQPFLGVNTTQPSVVTMKPDDAKVKFIRGEITQAQKTNPVRRGAVPPLRLRAGEGL